MPAFECRREVLLAATPEEVWEAVATSEGNAAWLFPNAVDADTAKAWEPPAQRLRRRRPSRPVLSGCSERSGSARRSARATRCA